MTKDGLREKVSRDLHRVYDQYATPITPAEQALLDRMK